MRIREEGGDESLHFRVDSVPLIEHHLTVAHFPQVADVDVEFVDVNAKFGDVLLDLPCAQEHLLHSSYSLDVILVEIDELCPVVVH